MESRESDEKLGEGIENALKSFLQDESDVKDNKGNAEKTNVSSIHFKNYKNFAFRKGD